MLFSVLLNLFPTANDMRSNLENHTSTDLSIYALQDLTAMKDKTWVCTMEVTFWSFVMFLLALFMGAMAASGDTFLFVVCGIFFFMSVYFFLRLSWPLARQAFRLQFELDRQRADKSL